MFYDAVKHKKDWNTFLKFLGEVIPLVFKNKLRIILGSKSDKFKNIEAQKKLVIPTKKGVLHASPQSSCAGTKLEECTGQFSRNEKPAMALPLTEYWRLHTKMDLEITY